MDLFVLCGGWDTEGQAVLGVYDSREEARVAGELLLPLALYDYLCVHQVPLGAGPLLRVDPLFYIGE